MLSGSLFRAEASFVVAYFERKHNVILDGGVHRAEAAFVEAWFARRHHLRGQVLLWRHISGGDIF